MIIKIDIENFFEDTLKEAANIVKAGGTIIFPTETLYGLGGKASSEEVLQKIYHIKKRSPQNPLPIMVYDSSMVLEVASEFPDNARKLTHKYWPGPLTVILKSLPSISPIITCGKKSAGIRIPDHQIALTLLKYVGEPMAVTSANLSGEDDLLDINQIIDNFKDKVDVILDGGSLEYGTPSTVVDMTADPPVILREGKISSEEIYNFLTESLKGRTLCLPLIENY